MMPISVSRNRSRLLTALTLAVVFTIGTTQTARAGMIISNGFGLSQYSDSGTFQGVLVPSGTGGLNSAHGLLLSGNELLVTGNHNSVLGFDVHSGSLLGQFSSGGNLSIARGIALNANGNLIVSSYATHQVLSFNGTTGSYLGVFASGGGLSGPAALAVDHGMLYVSDFNNSSILRFDALTGAPAPSSGQTGAVFVSSGLGGLSQPNMGLGFDLNGNLLVSSFGSNQLLRYNSSSGAFLGAFTTLNLLHPQGFAFGPNGNLYVVSEGDNRVAQFDGRTGAYLGDAIGSNGGLQTPTNIIFTPGVAAVPEPASIVSFGTGALMIVGAFLRRKK